jgi:hypothetical protein
MISLFDRFTGPPSIDNLPEQVSINLAGSPVCHGVSEIISVDDTVLIWQVLLPTDLLSSFLLLLCLPYQQ